jgi:hypothetical protein
LGLALRAHPEYEQQLRDGSMTLDACAWVGRLHADPRYERPGDDWGAAARTRPFSDLKRRVKERIAEVEQQSSGLVEISVFVTEENKDDFDRCRVIASRMEGKALTHDQTLPRLPCPEPAGESLLGQLRPGTAGRGKATGSRGRGPGFLAHRARRGRASAPREVR